MRVGVQVGESEAPLPWRCLFIHDDPICVETESMNANLCFEVPVRNWMSDPVDSIGPEATVRDALETMKSGNLSSVPVVDDERTVIGIVTLGDLARLVLSTDRLLDSDFPHYEDCYWAVDLIQRKLGSDRITTVMSENVATIGPNQTMREAAKQMLEQKIKHLAVCSDQQLLGMLSASDFVRMVAIDLGS